MVDFKYVTDQLLQTLDSLDIIYRDEEVVERNREFFNHVKQETEQYFIWIEKWHEHALNLSSEQKITIHPGQIDATVENLKALIMHSYYKDVRKRSYMEIKKSCHLVLNQSIEEWE